jgi:hypothetical protein
VFTRALHWSLSWASSIQSIPSHSVSLTHVHFPLLRSTIQRISPCPRFLVNICNKKILYGEELLAPRPTPKLEDHPLSAVRDCFFNILAATLRFWRPSPPSATWGRAMPWWQGAHLTWKTGDIGVKLQICNFLSLIFYIAHGKTTYPELNGRKNSVEIYANSYILVFHFHLLLCLPSGLFVQYCLILSCLVSSLSLLLPLEA